MPKVVKPDEVTMPPGHQDGIQETLLPGEVEPVGPTLSLERHKFVDGLYAEFDRHYHYYLRLVGQTLELQGRLNVAERNLVMTRDYLMTMLGETEEEVPEDWDAVLKKIRFVGVRLGNACLEILAEKKSLTTDDLQRHLNTGQFRFRTGSPLREIHAALLRQPKVKREDDRWVYKKRGPKRGKKMSE